MRVVLFVLVALCAATASARYMSEQEYGALFTKWMAQHNKQYEGPNVFQYRYQIWKRNMDFIIGYNQQGNNTATMAMNKFGDLTREEFSKLNGYRHNPNRPRNILPTITVGAAPTEIDWREKGAVTEIKNQESCGSCWAFSACASAEGANILAGHIDNTTSFAPQELVDCGSSTGNSGCEGGLMDYAFQWMINNGGIANWNAYPYTGEDGTCPTTLPSPAGTISSYVDVNPTDADLQAACAQRPVSVAIEADQAVFQFYSGGVINDASCGTNLDHGVLLVGYNLNASPAYYIVKNSWGTDWGLSGYVYIVAGTPSAPVNSANQCGITTAASYPVF